MPSLRQLLASHGHVLLLDAASSRIQVGWFAPNRNAAWRTSDEEAGIGLFRCIEALVPDVAEAKAFVFCDGPGSILGIRIAAMAIRAWQVLQARPVYSYSSLAVVAHTLAQPEIEVIADARRNLWHHYRIGGQLQRVAATELRGRLVMPENFRHWSPLPAGVTLVSYLLSELLPRVAEVDLFDPALNPDAFLHEEPNYATWTPQIHRAPTPS